MFLYRSVIRNVTVTKVDGGTPLLKQRCSQSNEFVRDKRNQAASFFHYVCFFPMEKSISHYRYYNFSHFMFVSVKICDNREFVKQLFNVLMKFRGKKNQYLGRSVHPKNGDPTQFLIKMGPETRSFVCNHVRWKQKINNIPVLRKHGIY